MPAPRRRASRCSYKEGNRRCPRDGDGSPALCRAHRLAVADAARPRKPIEVLAGALDSFFSGRRINVEETMTAADALLQQWAANAAAGNGAAPQPGRWVPPNWFPGAGRATQQPPPPPEDPRVAELAAVRIAARQVLGFAPSDVLTEDIIKDRRRRLAKKYHPDLAGGSVEKMARVNDAADVLLAALVD